MRAQHSLLLLWRREMGWCGWVRGLSQHRQVGMGGGGGCCGVGAGGSHGRCCVTLQPFGGDETCGCWTPGSGHRPIAQRGKLRRGSIPPPTPSPQLWLWGGGMLLEQTVVGGPQAALQPPPWGEATVWDPPARGGAVGAASGLGHPTLPAPHRFCPILVVGGGIWGCCGGILSSEQNAAALAELQICSQWGGAACSTCSCEAAECDGEGARLRCRAWRRSSAPVPPSWPPDSHVPLDPVLHCGPSITHRLHVRGLCSQWGTPG